MRGFIFDTETTGFDDPVIIEAAGLACDLTVDGIVTGQKYYRRYNPGKPISLGAMATHHIMDEDLVNCVPASEFKLPADVEYLIGHNVDFDWTAIGKPDVKRICTLAIARRVWPDTSHTQSALIYLLDRANARERLRKAHSAATDIMLCLDILQAELTHFGGIFTLEDLWALSEECRIPLRITFGKHNGKLIADLPADYKDWLLKQPDMDPYLIKAVRGSK